MTRLDRRSFARGLSLSGLAFLGFKLTGCGPEVLERADSRIADDGTVFAGETVTIFDLRMQAWSTLGSGQLGFTGVLRASQVKDDATLVLPYTQDPDGHKFTLAKEDLRKLRRGQRVSVITTVAQGHTHEVRIDPVADKVQGSEGITMPVDPDATTTPPPADEKLFAAFDETATPTLYTAGSAEMDPASMEYCLDAKERCAADATLWRRMKTYVSSGRPQQMFASEVVLAPDLTLAEQSLSVRGKTRAGNALVQTVFRLLKP
jgi:hypothetical protein